MTLVKTSILSAVATMVRILSGFIVTKVIAVYVGPSGLALIGQLQNFINIILLASGNFLKTAVTKYTAEYKEQEEKKYGLWSAALKITFLLSIVFFLLLMVFREQISQQLLHSEEYTYVLVVLALSMPFFIFNTILLSILNGQKQIRHYITLNIVLSIVSLLIISILSMLYGVDGALIAYVTNQSFVFFITLFYLRKEPWLKAKNFLYTIRAEHIKKLFAFAMITFVAVIASNTSMIVVRDYITRSLSLEDAGYWQGVWLLSQITLSLITTSLATYFLPTLSSLKTKHEISLELRRAIYIILPIAIIISCSIYLLREIIIVVLYSDQFAPMSELFLWQMIGNVIKVAGWLFGYVLVAKAMVKYTVTTEIIFATTFVLLSIYFVNNYGLVGVTYAFAINSFIHFLAMFFLYKSIQEERL